MTARRQLVVVGNGMVGHRLLEVLAELGGFASWQAVTFGEEPRPAYDRVKLSSLFHGATVEDLSLVEEGFHERHGATVHLGDRVVAVDPGARTVTSAAGQVVGYDALVLATGSSPFIPPVPGHDLPGAFAYRTIDDLESIAQEARRPGVTRGAVIGGGLLGLEAADALRAMDLEVHVVEFAPRLMPAQVDDGGGRALQRRIEGLGVHVHVGHELGSVVGDRAGRVARLVFASPGHDDLPADLVVFSAGIRPRDDLARSAGLAVGERGGVIVDDLLRTSAPDVWAIGECAAVRGRVHGLVAPGYEMARAVANQLVGGATDDAGCRFAGAEPSTTLKLLGVDVASAGDVHAAADGAREVIWDDRRTDVYRKLVLSPEGDRVLGGVLVGDAAAFGTLVQLMRGDLPVPASPEALVAPGDAERGPATDGVASMPASATVCSCENVTKARLCAAVADGIDTVGDLKASTGAGTCCGGCLPLVTDVLRSELARVGTPLSTALCEHFDQSRRELFDLVRVLGHETFEEVLARHGRGRGCEICKPTIASILASCTNAYVLDGPHAASQDTNDHFLANLQKDGTYSVVPRIPGGEITPDGLITIGEVARDFGLYTKITGGQRIDLLGARVEQLPAIWRRLVDAGFESGQAYGKSLRTVKSCVGETWCRYGVQDSTAMAIALELRYRGLRSPHKIKMAVSGCSRECAEAQSKDVGVIATERGWNLYVGGNGGQRPRHAVLLAEDLDDEELVRLIDRFLMLYVRTADRLQRTASWLEQLDGGLDHLRRVIVGDDLGLCGELEADMQRHVDTYECEWKATIDRPERVARFVSFVNAPDVPDPSIVFAHERGQIRPATPEERRAGREVAVMVR